MAEESTTEMERWLNVIDAALEDMAPPEPPSRRQLIIARQAKIRRMIGQGHRLPAIRDRLAKAGLDIPIGTLRDYVYNGEPSMAGRAAKVARERKKSGTKRIADAEQGEAFFLPDNATEATAGGAPVRARKMI